MENGKFLNFILSPFRSITGFVIAVVVWLTIVAGVLFYLTTDPHFLEGRWDDFATALPLCANGWVGSECG